MIRKQFYIAELIARHLSGILLPEEETELKAWRESSIRHEELFREICSTENMVKYSRTGSRFNKDTGWKELNRKLRDAKRRSLFFRLGKYAAVLIIPIVVGVFIIYTYSSHDRNEIVVVNRLPETIIQPGEKKATLTLGNGETVDLKAAPEKRLEEEDGTAITIDEDALNYQVAQANGTQEKEIYNKVDVPLGGEYALTLSDGTKIFMNAMSSLKFPVRFVNDRRVVELEGEAYFEVAGSEKPFIVRTDGVDVEVLGTVFNISAYRDEIIHTTLVEGSVRVRTASGDSRILKPSEQAYIPQDSEELKVRIVDVSEYISWVNGKISFKDQRLEDIMKNLSRWYDIDVEYNDQDVKNICFGCHVDRYKEITPFLELLEKTGKIKIAMNDNQITFNCNK